MTARGKRRWFLPETPDAIGLLRRQMAVTIEALEGLRHGQRATRRPLRSFAKLSPVVMLRSATC